MDTTFSTIVRLGDEQVPCTIEGWYDSFIPADNINPASGGQFHIKKVIREDTGQHIETLLQGYEITRLEEIGDEKFQEFQQDQSDGGCDL